MKKNNKTFLILIFLLFNFTNSFGETDNWSDVLNMFKDLEKEKGDLIRSLSNIDKNEQNSSDNSISQKNILNKNENDKKKVDKIAYKWLSYISNECNITNIPNNGNIFKYNIEPSCPSIHRQGAFAKYFKIKSPSEAKFLITLKSNKDTYLYLLDENGSVIKQSYQIYLPEKEQNQPIYQHTLIQNQIYYIEVTTYKKTSETTHIRMDVDFMF